LVIKAPGIIGDANLDGVVNVDDYLAIDRGYLLHLTGWANGDFSGDGVVNAADFALIDQAYGIQHPHAASALALTPSPSLATFLAGVAAAGDDLIGSGNVIQFVGQSSLATSPAIIPESIVAVSPTGLVTDQPVVLEGIIVPTAISSGRIADDATEVEDQSTPISSTIIVAPPASHLPSDLTPSQVSTDVAHRAQSTIAIDNLLAMGQLGANASIVNGSIDMVDLEDKTSKLRVLISLPRPVYFRKVIYPSLRDAFVL
jgi:hypothetical protein